MFNKITLLLLLSAVFAVSSSAQNIKRTTYKNELTEFGAGGTLTIIGAPNGSISIEGWSKNEVEILAEVENQAANETDLAEIAKVSGYLVDQSFGHIRIYSVGTHDKEYLKKVNKKFPKRLMNSVLRIDYKIKVPNFCDLDINVGNGDLTLLKVEGAIQIKSLEGNSTLDLSGGMVNGTFGKGNVDVKITTRSWRGRHASFQLGTGNLNVQFPYNLNADIDANILRTGKIENQIPTLKSRNRTKFSETAIMAKAGNGGALLTFIVGDGNVKLTNW